MSSITKGNAEQYGDSRKIAARARLHSEYTVADVGWFEWVARQLPLVAGDRVLDVGCGPGWFWAGVANILPDNLDLALTDLSPGMVAAAVERCQPRFGSVSGRVADAASLPFEDGAFDLVVAMHMMYHLPDPAAGIAEAWRVLRPGGTLAVTTNGAGNLCEMYALTTVLGSEPSDPAGIAFGYETAERLIRARFGNMTMSEHPARLRITEPEDVFLALTSYPPGDRADEDSLRALRESIDVAFRHGDGVLDARKEMALFLESEDRLTNAGGDSLDRTRSRSGTAGRCMARPP